MLPPTQWSLDAPATPFSVDAATLHRVAGYAHLHVCEHVVGMTPEEAAAHECDRTRAAKASLEEMLTFMHAVKVRQMLTHAAFSRPDELKRDYSIPSVFVQSAADALPADAVVDAPESVRVSEHDHAAEAYAARMAARTRPHASSEGGEAKPELGTAGQPHFDAVAHARVHEGRYFVVPRVMDADG